MTMRIGVLLSCGALALGIAAPATADDAAKPRTTKTKAKTKTKPVTAKQPAADVLVSKTRSTSALSEAAPSRDRVEGRNEDRRDAESRHFTIAPMLGYGSNDLGAGVGARVGHTFESAVYLGGNFMYHAGANDVRDAYYPSAELGYELVAGPALLRPYAGAGVFFENTLTRDTSAGLVYPGLTVHYLIPQSPAFIGGDARVLIPLDGTAAFAMTASTGLQL